MQKENSPIISEEFLEKLVEEINEQYGWSDDESLIDATDKPNSKI